jgi:hypothetical protein
MFNETEVGVSFRHLVEIRVFLERSKGTLSVRLCAEH